MLVRETQGSFTPSTLQKGVSEDNFRVMQHENKSNLVAEQQIIDVLFISLINPRIRVLKILVRPQISRTCMPLKILSPRAAPTKASNLTTRLLINDLLIRLSLEILANPEPAGIPTRLARRENVIRTDALEIISSDST